MAFEVERRSFVHIAHNNPFGLSEHVSGVFHLDYTRQNRAGNFEMTEERIGYYSTWEKNISD